MRVKRTYHRICSDQPSRAPAAAPFAAAAAAGAAHVSQTRRWRIAFTPDLGGIVPVEPEVAALCRGAADRCRELGAQVADACPDLHDAGATFQVGALRKRTGVCKGPGRHVRHCCSGPFRQGLP